MVELILSDHPADCLTCSKSGNCELQSLAQYLGIRDIPFKGEQSHYRQDLSPAIVRDVDKCVMCRRCENMCNNVQTVGALSAINRGFSAVVAPAFEQEALNQVGLLDAQIPPRYSTSYFNHVWGSGYAAGYYSYLWTEVLAVNIADVFAQRGALKPETGQAMRDKILSRGNTGDLMQMFTDFTGMEQPDASSLLKARGL